MAKGGATNAMAVLLKAVEGGFAGANASRQESKQDSMARQQQTSQQIGLALNVLNADRQAGMANQQLKLRQDALNQQMKHQTAMQGIAQQNKEATQKWREYQHDTGLQQRKEDKAYQYKTQEATRGFRERQLDQQSEYNRNRLGLLENRNELAANKSGVGGVFNQKYEIALQVAKSKNPNMSVGELQAKAFAMASGNSTTEPTKEQGINKAFAWISSQPYAQNWSYQDKMNWAIDFEADRAPQGAKAPTADSIKKEGDIVRNLASDAFAEFLVTDKDGQSALIFDNVKKPKQAGELVVRLAQNIQAAEKQLEETYGRPLTKLEKNNLRWPLKQVNKKGLSYYQQIRDKVGNIPATVGGPSVRAYLGRQPEERTPNALYSAVADALNIIQPSVMPINPVGGMPLDQLANPVLELDQKLGKSDQILKGIPDQARRLFSRTRTAEPVNPELEEALKAWGQPDVNRKLTEHSQYRR